MSIPGQIIEIVDSAQRLARVSFDGQQRVVNLMPLPAEEGVVGDWVLVQAGLAVERLSEAEAQNVVALVRELEQMFEEPV
jgi:hydrogenase expression/formation protein HypC